MKRFLVPIIVLASSLVSTAVIASEAQVIHSNDKPKSCKMTKEGKVIGTCSSFKFAKQDKLYMFAYNFKGNVIGFLAIPFDENENTATYAVGQLYYGGKVHDLKDPGVCVATKRYEMVRCSADDVEAEYTHW